jgi:hypothetical protein
MYYVYIEDSKIVSILNYIADVPKSVKMFGISDLEYEQITGNPRTHYFDLKETFVKPIPAEEKEKIEIAYENEENNRVKLNFLNDTDWKVLRHIREKALEEQTTLTEEEYLSLERQRAEAAAGIVK